MYIDCLKPEQWCRYEGFWTQYFVADLSVRILSSVGINLNSYLFIFSSVEIHLRLYFFRGVLLFSFLFIFFYFSFAYISVRIPSPPFLFATYTFPSVFVVFNLILLIIMYNWCNVNYEYYIYLKEYFHPFTKNYNGGLYRNLFNIHFVIIFLCHIKK